MVENSRSGYLEGEGTIDTKHFMIDRNYFEGLTMTPQLKAAIAIIEPLSGTDRQQLKQHLHQRSNTENTIEILNTEFWQGLSIDQLRISQSITPIRSLKELAADFWPVEDSIEEFLDFLKAQHQTKNDEAEA